MPVPANASQSQISQYFADALGADAVYASPSTGRPYVKVATKAGAVLLLNVDLIDCYHQIPAGDGKPAQTVPAIGVILRFFQKGGTGKEFTPPLNARSQMDKQGVMRLSKHTFPMCLKSAGVSAMAAWEEQSITEQLMEWVKGIANFSGGETIADGPLQEIVEMVKGKLVVPTDVPTLFFSLDVHVDSGGTMADDYTPVDGDEEEEEEEDQDET